ncbi:hypothetical protein DFQ50_11838, partial [Pseudocitrobacter faecalis]
QHSPMRIIAEALQHLAHDAGTAMEQDMLLTWRKQNNGEG